MSDAPLGPRARVNALLERLPCWRWEEPEVGTFEWEEYAPATETVFPGTEDPAESVMFARASDLTREAVRALAADHRWCFMDTDGREEAPPPEPEPGAFV